MLFAILRGSSLSTDIDSGLLSTIANSSTFIISGYSFVSFVISITFLSTTIADGCLFSITSDDLNTISLSISPSAYFLSDTLFCVLYFFLSSIGTPFYSFIMLIIGKRLFDKVFFKQKLLALIQL